MRFKVALFWVRLCGCTVWLDPRHSHFRKERAQEAEWKEAVDLDGNGELHKEDKVGCV